MSEIIIAAYVSGVVTFPLVRYVAFPIIKKKMQERWNKEWSSIKKKKQRGRPKGSKNKPKEETK